ncbi:MAG: gamma-butyrobetaine hydroxylase-like domain-containing protein [Bacillota bacterium]
MLYPKKIKLNGKESLTITWNNQTVHSIPLKFLRDESPDAGNKGETILWRHYEAPQKGPDKPGKYEVEKIDLVGDYAINIRWKDGYDYGIYSWNLLWRLGEFIEVKDNLHQDFEHDQNHEHHNKKKEKRDE